MSRDNTIQDLKGFVDLVTNVTEIAEIICLIKNDFEGQKKTKAIKNFARSFKELILEFEN